jgi:outer membrane protein TolC
MRFWKMIGPLLGLLWPLSALAQNGEVRLTPGQAVRLALRQNLDLEVEKLNPNLSTASERAASAVFDPVLFGDTGGSGTPGQNVSVGPAHSQRVHGDVGLRKSFSTGTKLETSLGTSALFGAGGGPSRGYLSALSATVTQSLLRGSSLEANEVGITTARLVRFQTEDLLLRKAELVAADTLKAYYDLHAALSNVGIQKVALSVSQKTLSETTSLIQAGKIPAAEAAAADYQVQKGRRDCLVAEQTAQNLRDRLARLIGLVDPRSLATPQIVTATQPRTNVPVDNPTQLQATALRWRGDYRALKSDLDARRVLARAARHNLLPKLDFLAGVNLMGLSGATGTETANARGVGSSYLESLLLKNFGWAAGLVLEVPLENREARAKAEIADLEYHRSQALLERLVLSISQDLNVSWRSLQSAREQLEVTAAALRLAETKLANELERYRAGKTTAQILSLMQDDLVKERLAREQAVVDFNKALVDLWATSGVLIGRIQRRKD